MPILFYIVVPLILYSSASLIRAPVIRGPLLFTDFNTKIFPKTANKRGITVVKYYPGGECSYLAHVMLSVHS